MAGADAGPTHARVRVLPPRTAHLPAPLSEAAMDAQQRAAWQAVRAGGNVVVYGAPGSGRTSLALTLACASEGDTWWVAPRRLSSARIADALAVHGASPRVRAVTPAALAFGLIKEASRREGRAEPTLVTGADQDALMQDLIAMRETWALRIEPETRSMLAFRTQLRDLMTRAQELGISAADLARLSQERGRPAWSDAAELMREYVQVLELESSMAVDAGLRLDSGGMVRRAVELLARDHELPRPDLLIVDDAQDLTPAAVELVAELSRTARATLITTSPDSAVESFRGARADAAVRLVERLAQWDAAASPLTQVHTIHLDARYRGGADTRRAIDALRARVPLAGASTSTRRQAVPETRPAENPGPEGGDLSVLIAPSRLDEARAVAGALRLLHHRDGIDYADMAVVCRSGAAVESMADLLARHDLPVTLTRRLRPLREEPVVADLLRIIEMSLDTESSPEPDEVLALLRGPFGDADSLRLRRVRRALVREDPDSALSSGDMLAEVITGARAVPESKNRTADPVLRVRAMVEAVRSLPADHTAIDALWAAWDAAGVAEGWRYAAVDTSDADGSRSRLTHARLDAISALFAVAERFTDRRPTADAQVFIDHIRQQNIAEDSLAPTSTPAGRVAVLTPNHLAGEDRHVVVLSGVDEGAWPNTQIRSSIFGAAELSLVATYADAPTEASALRAMQREDVIADEIRLAVSALSRARSRVLVTSTDDASTTPSALVMAIAEAVGIDPKRGGGWCTAQDAFADPGPAPDARHLVASLRTRALSGSPDEQREAIRLLQRLDAAQIPGAHPDSWYHQSPSSTEPVVGDGKLNLSPSSLERAYACPQSWLLQKAGGTAASGPHQGIGTALHRIAQEHPDGHVPDLLRTLHDLLRPLGLKDTWSGRARLRHAESAAESMVAHLQASPPALAVEAPFVTEVEGVTVRGMIDRIEGTATELRVVDLKTGRSAKSQAAAEEDLQLASYQTAVTQGALDETLGDDAARHLTGAQLVYVGTGTRTAAVRTQRLLRESDAPDWFENIVHEVKNSLSSPQIRAVPNAMCDLCPVKRSCVLYPEGAEL